MTSARKPLGFTLIEVLAALVLMAIVLPVAMHGISLATSLAGTARQREEAAVLADSKLNELVATHGWQTSSLNGDFDSHSEYRWSADVLDWDGSTLKQLNVHVYWKFRNAEREVTLSTLVDTP